jgi:hypothetical protein
MSGTRNLTNRVDEFFFAKLPVYPLVVCRITFGLVLFFAYATKSTHLQFIFGPDGLSGAAFHSRAPMDWPHGRALESSIQWLHLSSSESLVWILWAGLLISTLFFVVGFRTRTSGVIALLIHTSLHAQNYTATLGWAVMIKPFMAYVILSRAGDFGSVDAYRRRRSGSPKPDALRVPGWPLRLLQIHVCTMYLVAGWLRVMEPSWQNGEMIFVALNDQWYSRFSLNWLAIRDLLRPLSIGPFILEPLAPVLLWFRRVGPLWALGLMSMHLVLELMSNVGWWQYVMFASLTTFLPTAWIVRLIPFKNPLERGESAPSKVWL